MFIDTIDVPDDLVSFIEEREVELDYFKTTCNLDSCDYKSGKLYIKGSEKSIQTGKTLAPVHFALLRKKSNERSTRTYTIPKTCKDISSVIPDGLSYTWKGNKLIVAGTSMQLDKADMAINYFLMGMGELPNESSDPGETNNRKRKKKSPAGVVKKNTDST